MKFYLNNLFVLNGLNFKFQGLQTTKKRLVFDQVWKVKSFNVLVDSRLQCSAFANKSFDIVLKWGLATSHIKL